MKLHLSQIGIEPTTFRTLVLLYPYTRFVIYVVISFAVSLRVPYYVFLNTSRSVSFKSRHRDIREQC